MAKSPHLKSSNQW